MAKFSQFAPLSAKDIGLLEALCAPEQRFRAGARIVIEGETPCPAFVVTRGMACRYRLMPDGRRQILGILIPGDFFDLHGFLLRATDHSVGSIGPTRIWPATSTAGCPPSTFGPLSGWTRLSVCWRRSQTSNEIRARC